MSQLIDTLRCPRGLHILAQLYVDASGLRVDANQVAQHKDGISKGPRVYRVSDIIGDFDAVDLTCGCGRRFQTELVAPFRDRKFGPVRTLKKPGTDTPDDISVNRRTNAGTIDP